MSSIESVSNARKELSQILSGQHGEKRMVAIVGPCSANEQNLDVLNNEGERLRQLAPQLGNLAIVHRMPIWKPRSRPEDWHGLETTSPEAAEQLLFGQAEKGGRVAIEIAQAAHIHNYKDALSFGWTGSRNVDNRQLLVDIALSEPMLPMGVKNDLTGDIQSAVDLAKLINDAREDADSQRALATVIYRGGENFSTPSSWRRQYIGALALTNGRLIVDVAHGSEMAHDPTRRFQKSVAGQIAAMNSVIDIAGQGILPAGVMIEASDGSSTTDPNMPFDIAIDGLRRLNTLVAKG